MGKIKIGIFGGSFSPPHMGHIKAAKAFVTSMNLDKLLIIPALMPPHKELNKEASVIDRLKMCEIAFSDVKNAEISSMEIDRGGKSYTYLTLQQLKNDDNELYMLVGTDMLLTLDEWKNPEVIFSLAKVCYIRREKDELTEADIISKIKKYKENYSAEIIAIPADAFEISSTELRNKIISGEDISSLMDERVVKYIFERGLYSC